MMRAPASSRIRCSCSDETRAGSYVTEKSCQPSLALSSLNSTGSCASSRPAATRASGSRCQAHCLGTSPQTDVVAATVASVSDVGLTPAADGWQPTTASNSTPIAANLHRISVRIPRPLRPRWSTGRSHAGSRRQLDVRRSERTVDAAHGTAALHMGNARQTGNCRWWLQARLRRSGCAWQSSGVAGWVTE